MIGSLQKFQLVKLWLILAVFFIVSTCAAQGNSPVSASVEPAQVTVGDTVLYQVTVQVTGAGQPSIAVPVIDPDTGLSTPVPSGTQTSAETYIFNGRYRSVQSIIYNYAIRTSKEGKFNIPPATVTLNGKTYDTESVQVTVRPVPQAKNIPTELQGLVVAPQVQGNPELQRKLTGVVFVLPVISTTEPYNGEQVRLSYHLVIDPKALAEAGLLPRTNLDNIRVPQLSEFIAEELYPFPQDLKFQEREIGGQLYLVAPVYEAVITSTKSGNLKIEPFQISMLFSLRSQGSRTRTPFDDDPILSSMTPLGMLGGGAVNVIAQSPEITMNVKPIPEDDRPSDFAGAVGKFSLAAEVDKKQARAYDDTIKLNLTVEGEGNAESLSAPSIPNVPAFTVLGEPEEEVSGRKLEDKYLSAKKFTYTLRPTSPGKHTIPPVTMSTFDPKTGQFEQVKSDPIDLDIAPGTRPAPAPAPETAPDVPAEQPIEADLRYISTESLTAPGTGIGWIRGPASSSLFILPLALLIGSFAYAWQKKHGGERQVDLRKLASISSSHHLKEAHRSFSAGEVQRMYAELAEGLRLYFASQFAIPPAEATVPEIEERLQRKGATAELISRITNLLEDCDSARYARVSPTKEHAAAALREGEQLLKDVRSHI